MMHVLQRQGAPAISLRQGRILIIRHNALGELIMTTPLLHYTRKQFPNFHLSLLATPYALELFKYCDDMDELIVMPSNNTARNFLDVIPMLKKTEFTHFFCPMDCDAAAWVGEKLQIPIRVGFTSVLQGQPFTHPVSVPDHIYKPLRLLHLLQPFVPNISKLETILQVVRGNNDTKQARCFFKRYHKSAKPLIGLNIGGKIKNKRWPYENFISLGRWIRTKLNFGIILFAGHMENEKKVCDLAKSIGPDVLVCYNHPLHETAEIIRQCRLMVTNDSSLSWLTAAVRVPAIILFRPCINMDSYKPMGDKFIGIQAWYDPFYFSVKGMHAISVEQVKIALTRLLEETD